LHGRELWKSDGTTAGTQLVKDIEPGRYGSDPRTLTAVGDVLFFSRGDELWKSDGSEAGTILVKDIATEMN
jgi:ELWxxDGT repeat protein